MRAKRLRRSLMNDRGAATVEFVLWLPFFFLLLGVLVDSVLLMHRQTMMFDVARAASRQVALGLADAATAEAAARGRLTGSPGETVDVTVDAGLVTARIGVPFAEVVLFGDMLTGDAVLGASVTMVQEAADDEAG